MHDADGPLALGAVVERERGSLPFALIHGESLVGCAALALEEAGVQAVDLTTTWETIGDTGEAFVLHDALCPMTPPAFLAACAEQAISSDVVVVGVRPVTDTVKTVAGGLIAETLDREQLLAVASPIVLPASVVGRLEHRPDGDFAELVGDLAQRFPVVTVEAPPEGRRVGTPEDVRVLEALTPPEGRWAAYRPLP